MDAFRSHTQKSQADCGRRWEVVEIFQKNFSLEQVCAPPRRCRYSTNARIGRVKIIIIIIIIMDGPRLRIYCIMYMYILYTYGTSSKPNSSLFIHQRIQYKRTAFIHGPTIIITIRRARCIIIILYTRSVLLRLAAAATAASIPLAVPTPKCLGRTK